MAYRSATGYDINTSDELDLSALPRGQVIQMVIDLRRRLDEHQAKADRQRELVAIHHDTAERAREAVTQVNHQLLTQIKSCERHCSGSSS